MKLYLWKTLERATTPLGWILAFFVVLANVLLWLIYLSPFLIVGYAIVTRA